MSDGQQGSLHFEHVDVISENPCRLDGGFESSSREGISKCF